jgi:hypothetical protein
MGYNYHLVAYLELKDKERIRDLKEVGTAITFDEHYERIYQEAYRIDHIHDYFLWREDEDWHIGTQFLTMKDSEGSTIPNFTKELHNAIMNLGRILGRQIDYKDVLIKYGSEGNPLVVVN